MGGTRRPIDINLQNPNNHYTKAQVEERRGQEASLPKPKSLKAPKWLSKEAATLFRAYSKELLANLPVSTLDTGTLARLCDAEWSYGEASRHKSAFLCIARKTMDTQAAAAALTSKDQQDNQDAYTECQAQIAYWTKQMSILEKIARGCANDLGCTIASRCRMIVPQTKEPEADPLESLMEALHVV